MRNENGGTRPVRPSDQKKRTERPPLQAQKNSKEHKNAYTVDEEEIHVHHARKGRSPKNVEEDLEVEYDEDFEQASEEEEYTPQMRVPQNAGLQPIGFPQMGGTPGGAGLMQLQGQAPPTGPFPMAQKSPISKTRQQGTPGGGGIMPVQKQDDMSDLKRAMEAERIAADQRKAQQQQQQMAQQQQPNFAMPPPPDMTAMTSQFITGKEGSPKSNVSVQNIGIIQTTQYTTSVQMSTVEREKQMKRVKELRQLIKRKLCVERHDVYSQRPQRKLELFLNNRGPYAGKITKGTQTGEELLEESTQTEKPMTEEQETQAPSLVIGSKDEGQTQLLPFLRRVFPLVEATLQNSKVSKMKRKQKDSTDTKKIDIGNILRLDFATVQSVVPVPSYLGSAHLLVLYSIADAAPIKYGSVICLYPVDALRRKSAASRISQSSNQLLPQRIFYSFEKLTCMDFFAASSIVVCGSVAGSVVLYDLRHMSTSNQTTSEDAMQLGENSPGGSDMFTSTLSVDGHPLDNTDLEPPVHSTDFLGLLEVGDVISPTNKRGKATKIRERSMKKRNDDLDLDFVDDDMFLPAFMGEITDITCTRDLVFVLDFSGTVTMWRILERDKNAVTLQYSSATACGPCPTALCSVPREVCPVGNFLFLSLAGKIGRGLEENNGTDATKSATSVAGLFELDNASSPSSICFHPIFTTLFAVAYWNGDVGIFEVSVAVPIAHWIGCVSTDKTKSSGKTPSVAWSTTRPTILFVYDGNSELQIWDLSQSLCGPIDKYDVPQDTGAFESTSSTGAPTLITAAPESGLPVIVSCGRAVVVEIPKVYVTPLTAYPTNNALLQLNEKYDSRNNFFDRSRDNITVMKKILENKATKLEIDILHKVLLMV